tara:strand:+ start:1060 stop:1929 length:870 start_codon:yes stop_codon:yes gene_type:complete
MNESIKKQKRLVFDPDKLRSSRARSLSIEMPNIIYDKTEYDIESRLEDIRKEFKSILIITKNIKKNYLHKIISKKSEVIIIGPNYNANKSNYIVVDDNNLPFHKPKFDLIISDLILHTSNNLKLSLENLRNLLLPDGLLIATMFGQKTLFDLKQCLISAEDNISGKTYPRINPFIDIKTAGDILYSSGFKLCVVDSYDVRVKYSQASELIQLIRSMGENNYINLNKPSLKRKVWIKAINMMEEKNDYENYGISEKFEILTLTGWKFHENQQKPMKPGSAKHKLADFLEN